MNMKIIKSEKCLCVCCMEIHEVKTVLVREKVTFKRRKVDYDALYQYCDNSDELYMDERQIQENDIRLKNAYRKKEGLLTSDEICAIRAKYNISQKDLCTLLGWGGKTITRYESHQVQDVAHDTILRKLDSDPEWFLQLLNTEKEAISSASYEKYVEAGTALFEQEHDLYLKSAIMSKYARYLHSREATGGKELSLDVVVNMIQYIANSSLVTNLYLVKMMKLLWYADALSFKRYEHSISGLVYRALPMGAVPVAYETIIDLSNIHFEEIEIGEGTGYRFLPTKNTAYDYLTTEDKEVLDAVLKRFGKATKKEIVETMHKEDAYTETAPSDIIQFKYAKTLSLA